MSDAAVPVSETLVAQVVADVSERMREPSYAQVAVGSFVEGQPQVVKFLSAQSSLNGETVVHVVFHCELIAECLRRHREQPELSTIGFARLGTVASDTPLQDLQKLQPALADYIHSNIDEAAHQKLLAHVALALSR